DPRPVVRPGRGSLRVLLRAGGRNLVHLLLQYWPPIRLKTGQPRLPLALVVWAGKPGGGPLGHLRPPVPLPTAKTGKCNRACAQRRDFTSKKQPGKPWFRTEPDRSGHSG